MVCEKKVEIYKKGVFSRSEACCMSCKFCTGYCVQGRNLYQTEVSCNLCFM